MSGTGKCVTVNANYHPPPPHPTDFIDVRQLVFRNIKGTGCKASAEFICPEQSPCQNITLDNVHVDGGKMTCEHAFGTAVDGVDPTPCLEKK